MRLTISITLLCILLAATRCAGGGEGVKVALHLRAHNAKQGCTDLPPIAGCGDIVSTYAGCGDIDAFTVFYDLDGYRAAEWALTWPAEWGSGVTRTCAPWVNGNIVWPGDRMCVDWPECEPGAVMVAAWTHLTADTPGMVEPIHPGSPYDFGICDCDYEVHTVTCVFGAGACGMYGGDPCGPTASEAGTWGAIKSMFR
jgi:hypothetical protein